ncbi:MAG TPA: PadR family transcriptional regulator [Longimicrobium sp.]|nr:PadR family transcriptional regulator [Longimicrobium sp.]
MGRSNTLLHGALDALILRTLTGEPRHGYAIARWLESETDQALRIEEGSLYPALYRLEERGWVEAEWGVSELGRSAKFYRLTPEGRAQLVTRTREWEVFASAVSRILLGPAGPAGAVG